MRISGLRGQRDSRALRERGRAYDSGSGLFSARVVWSPEDAQEGFLGVIVKKKIGGAVLRNRIRRRFRAAFRALCATPCPAPFLCQIFVKDPRVGVMPWEALVAEMKNSCFSRFRIETMK